MRKALVVAITAVVSTVSLAVAAKDPVNLDQPGVLESLMRDNPTHYDRATNILKAAADMPCQLDEFAKVMRVKFEAKDAKCGTTLLTSEPAKRRLTFTLDDTQYVAVVMMNRKEKLVPLTK